jgi:exosortase
MSNVPSTAWRWRLPPGRLAAWLLMVAVLGWSYASLLTSFALYRWSQSDYLYCYLVAPFALYLLWSRRGMIAGAEFRTSLWGLALLAVAALVRLLAAYLQTDTLDLLSLVPSLAGIALLGGGWTALRWAWPAVLFAGFLVPLPGEQGAWLSGWLQEIGAVTSTYLLQVFGVTATVHGTTIELANSGYNLGVEEACSGVRMLMLFVAVCVGAAMIIRRDPWERIVLILSAPPIAVVANVLRITITGILHETAGREWGETVFHELTGWFMMPLAVTLVWLEMALLAVLFPPEWDDGRIWKA